MGLDDENAIDNADSVLDDSEVCPEVYPCVVDREEGRPSVLKFMRLPHNAKLMSTC